MVRLILSVAVVLVFSGCTDAKKTANSSPKKTPAVSDAAGNSEKVPQKESVTKTDKDSEKGKTEDALKMAVIEPKPKSETAMVKIVPPASTVSKTDGETEEASSDAKIDARALLATTLQAARDSDKRVLVHLGAPW